MSRHVKPSLSRSGVRGRAALAGVLVLGAGLAASALAQPARPASPARLIPKPLSSAVPDQYIVVLDPSATVDQVMAAADAARKMGAAIGFTYTAALRGFSVKAAPSVVDKLRTLPNVSYLEADSVYSASVIQLGPPKGLDRTSERFLALDNRYTYSSTGAGVHAYVIDSGIRQTHVDFGGRASGSFTAIADTFGTSDCNGHGTHVAGTLGGTTYGIAKGVWLHSVRVLDCAGSGTLSGILGGVNWVTANAVHPAVANMSLGGPLSPTLNSAVAASVASGVTYAVAAGNNTVDACTVSPASEPTAITVGAVNPLNDTQSWFSNFGPCLDLFAPGEGILSAWATSDTATNTIPGTSMASPHVAGVAALYLQTHTAASPATVWAAIHYADDVSTTVGWPGVIGLSGGSPNELLHWGSLNDGHDDGDPHLATVEGVHYDFQSAGEFVLLRDGNGVEIQARQSPVATASAITNGYTGLTSCVSLNTAVAAQVGAHRVSYEPNLSGIPDPAGLQLRIDGVLTTLPPGGVNLGPGGHIAGYVTGGIVVDFPDGTTLIATPNWWPSQSRWYLNLSVFHTQASEGILGARPTGSWLPALPGGGSMGPMPATLHQRYVDLNATFASAWRVTPATSLFDYAPGTSTATFTIAAWPPENPPCVIPEVPDPPVQPLDPRTAQQLCRGVLDPIRNRDCFDDVRVTGEPGFADIHRASEAVVNGSTRTWLDDARSATKRGEDAVFTATVMPNAAGSGAVPAGDVQFLVDGRATGAPIKLDDRGQAVWRTAGLEAGVHEITASFLAAQGSAFLPSTSLGVTHTVR